MFATVKDTSKHYALFWHRGVLPLLIALLASGFVGVGTGIAGSSPSPHPAIVSRQQAASAPAMEFYEGGPYIGWTSTNTAHNLNVMTYNTDTNAFGSTQILTETTLAGSGPALVNWNGTLYIAWRGTDNQLNVGQYDDAHPTHLANKVTLSEHSLNAPSIAAWNNRLYLGWRGTDGRLNIITSTNGRQFSSKLTYPIAIRTSPTITYTPLGLVVAWEDMSTSSHIVVASYSTSISTLLKNKVTLTATSQLPVGLTAFSSPRSWIGIAWRTASDAHIHLGVFEGSPVLQFAVETAQTTPYGPGLTLFDYMAWTGTDTAHSVNVTLASL